MATNFSSVIQQAAKRQISTEGATSSASKSS